jgi:hypothetical protein
LRNRIDAAAGPASSAEFPLIALFKFAGPLLTLLLLVAIAAGVQQRAPQAKTFSQAIKSLRGQLPDKK